jgi:hypothetical protein
MYTEEQLLDIYKEAYFNETGNHLSPQSLDKITFDNYKVTYDSSNDRMEIDIFEFDDNDSFPYPDTVVLVNKSNRGWVLV